MHCCFGIQLFIPWVECEYFKKVPAKQVYLCLLGGKRILQFSWPRVKRKMTIQTQGNSKAVTGSQQQHQIISDYLWPCLGELQLHLQTRSGADLHQHPLIPFAEFSSLLHTWEPLSPRGSSLPPLQSKMFLCPVAVTWFIKMKGRNPTSVLYLPLKSCHVLSTSLWN